MKSPYISRVKIKNFRNFKDIDVLLNHKQVIIGENNVGKTNFIRAIQLILDRSFSDVDRELIVSDFHDSIKNPMENGEVIEIVLEIQNYEHNRQLLAQFNDAVISVKPPILRLTYRYYPIKDENGKILRYDYVIFKGESEVNIFTRMDRNFINIYVIGALRDVERELNANKRSPLYKLVQDYNIEERELDDIAESMKDAAEEILKLDEIKDIKEVIQNKFQTLTGLQNGNEISLSPYDLDTERLLYTIQVYMGLKQRPVADLSLGLANILYLSMMLLLLRDKTIPRVIKNKDYSDLVKKDSGALVSNNYSLSDSMNNYCINDDVASEVLKELYAFFDSNSKKPHSVTFLAVEEPESHLHPVLQRLIYREILQKNESSVIFTTHSPYITAVAPIETLVHVKYIKNQSKIFSTISVNINQNEKKDIERYLDAKRGEIYFGKGVLLVEGITEEYMIPRASELMGVHLEDYGIIVCNVHSTNFQPYVQILKTLNIPWCLITDGDFYKKITTTDTDGNEKTKKRYHELFSKGDIIGYKGLELISKMLIDVNICKETDLEINNINNRYEYLKSNGCFVGEYTNEIDSMIKGKVEGIAIFKKVYSELRPGGNAQQKNFDDALDTGNYWKALKKIDDNISKGRFAQRFASYLTLDIIPDYIINAIIAIIDKVKDNNE